ncbi:LOW QUALITY PROTEIN: exocyst complex component 6B-like [Anomaloglossus baeobatrachus]
MTSGHVQRGDVGVRAVPGVPDMAELETAAEHERILREIESTETACIGPTLRSVYDGEEHSHFMEKLEVRIRNHDREIEKMCNFHYQGFVDSITELLKVRGEAEKLKNQVMDTNRRLQLDGAELLSTMKDLQQCRIQQRNIAATVEKLSLCLPVLEMYSKLREQMRAKRHYPALKTLEQMEHTYLPQVSHYRFCRTMVENIPKLREEIKDVSMSDLKDFLESIRKHSERIGESAMKQAQQQRSLDNILTLQTKGILGRRYKKDLCPSPEMNGTSPMSEQDSGILDVEDEDEEEEAPGTQDLVDFSPVYRCLHIYTVLASREVFENYYRKQRRKQARLVLQPPSNMHETGRYRKYFHQIAAVDTHSRMPGKVAQTACMSACKHLSTSLTQLLLEADVKQITMGALQQFNLDVKECERFARSGPVPGFQGDTLQLAFIDLRQLLDLFIKWDWSTYLADYGQPNCKYLRVNPTTALTLLEKMKDPSRKNVVFAQFRKNERDKQKLIETVAKQLRGLINSHHS